MKKLIVALALLLTLCLALGIACADGLDDAASYVKSIYKNRPASTPKDYQLIGSVPGDGDKVYNVEWTTDSDTIAFTRDENGMVNVNVDEDNNKEVAYVLTATVKDAAGNASISFDRVVPASIKLDILSEEEIVEIAYTLEDGDKLPAPTALTGKVVAIPSAWSEQYGNITVNIQVGGQNHPVLSSDGRRRADSRLRATRSPWPAPSRTTRAPSNSTPAASRSPWRAPRAPAWPCMPGAAWRKARP